MIMKRFWLKCMLLTVLLGMLAIPAGPAALGQAVRWSSPVALSPEGSFAWFPDILADASGQVHAVWASGVSGYDQVIYSVLPADGKWTTPNDIFALPQVGSNSAATRPALLLDRSGRVHVSFADLTKVYYSNARLADAARVNGWAPKFPISGDQTAYFSRTALDSRNRLHLVFSQNAPSEACQNCYHIYYRQSVDGGASWSAAVDLVNDAIGAVKPQILVDAADRIQVVWEAGLGGGLGQLTGPTYVAYVRSEDGGKSWSKAVRLNGSGTEDGKNITIGMDRLKNLVAAWWALPSDQILYRRSSDGGRSWSEPAAVPQVWGAAAVFSSKLDDYAVANDGDGNLHLVAVGRRAEAQKSLDVLDLRWDGEAWSAPDPIATYTGDVPEWPRVTISQGNRLHAAWFVRDEPHIWLSDEGRYRVWYASGTINAAYVKPGETAKASPVLTPTAAPAASPTASRAAAQATATAAVTAMPLPAAAQPVSAGLPSSESEALVLLGKALLPSAAAMIAIVLVVLWRQRRP